MPLAGFLLLHLSVQASALWGWQSHRRLSAALDAGPFGVVLEVACIYVPLGVHLVLGVLRHDRSERRAGMERVGHIVQRVSAAALIAFLAVHLWQFRWRLWTGQMDRADMFPELAASLSSTAFGGIPVMAAAYLGGLAAAALHGAQSVYAACCEWRLVAPARQRALGRACAAAGVAAFLLGATLVIDLATGSAIIRFPG